MLLEFGMIKMNIEYSLQNIYRYQKMESGILKRSISIYEALALWLSEENVEVDKFENLLKDAYDKMINYN